MDFQQLMHSRADSNKKSQVCHSFNLIGIAAVLLILGATMEAGRQSNANVEKHQREEQQDYYGKWLNENVVFIISPEEKTVFEALTSPEEKEQFIEQFWFRRDSDPRTKTNEFREEHYRRIAYANENYSSGLPGWKSDRGRIYIIHGPPDSIEMHPSGGRYMRPLWEGGGTTSTYPFEIWWYRHIEGVGEGIELEFVDPSFSGEYRLALSPEEKDAMLHVPGVGLTLAEQYGMATKADRPTFSPGNRDYYPLRVRRAKDNPFIRYETFVGVQRPKKIKYDDLKEVVDVNVAYSELAVELRKDYFKLNDEQVLVAVTLTLDHDNLTFKEDKGVYLAKVGVYGLVTTLTKKIIKEFEDDLIQSYRTEFFKQGLPRRSTYQKIIALDRKLRYKLSLVVKDLNSGKVGVIRDGIFPPSYSEEDLVTSSLVLSDSIRQLEDVQQQDQMFVLGDLKIRPSIDNIFSSSKPLGVYLQVYNAAIDESTLRPSLRVKYRLSQGGQNLAERLDEDGEPIQFFSPGRVVLVTSFSAESLRPGIYRMEVEVQDRIRDQLVTVGEKFHVVDATQLAVNR